MKKVVNSFWVTFKEDTSLFAAYLRVEIDAIGDISPDQFKNYIKDLYNKNILTVDHKSCEIISDELADHISKDYPNRHIKIEVSQNYDNGYVYEYSPNEDGIIEQSKSFLDDAYDSAIDKIDQVKAADISLKDVEKETKGFFSFLKFWEK